MIRAALLLLVALLTPEVAAAQPDFSHLKVQQSITLPDYSINIPPMSHTPVRAANLPAPVGPYSPGMGFERLIFVSGQGGTDPATGTIAADVEQQTEQCLKNVQTILEAAGSGLQHVLRCGVFLMDMGEFKKMNAVYARMFGDHRPARTTVQVAGLPGDGLRVEIDAIAYRP
jgi:2-iminobutanoate/2-iminopropanoate deaminase